jgi:hypothetical protein
LPPGRRDPLTWATIAELAHDQEKSARVLFGFPARARALLLPYLPVVLERLIRDVATVTLAPAFALENRGFPAHQCVETLLKGSSSGPIANRP